MKNLARLVPIVVACTCARSILAVPPPEPIPVVAEPAMPAGAPCVGDADACACDVAVREEAERFEEDRVACADGLSRAVLAIGAGRFEEAVKAIDATVDRCTRETSAEPLGERGWAKLSIGHAAAALKDFDGALDFEEDAVLGAHLLIDRGEALRALGRAHDADESFYWANRLSASEEAKSRLSVPSFCPVRVTHGERATVDRGWLAWWKRRAAEEPPGTALTGANEPPVITDDASVRAALAPTCKGPSPWVVQWRFPEFELRIVATRGGGVLDFGVAGRGLSTMTAMARPYGYGDDVTLSQAGRFTLVHALSVGRQVRFDPVPPIQCTMTAAWQSVVTASHATETYLVLDVARGVVTTRIELTHRFALRLEDDVSLAALPVSVKPGATGFEVSEPGCGVIPYGDGR